MCECGCTANDRRYWFPGPGNSFYVLVLASACDDCDAPSGVILERHDRDATLRSEEILKDETDGPLQFDDWGGIKGVSVVTGLRQQEFISQLKSHLIGVSSEEMGENGVIDEDGAEVILEEMYDDSIVKPHFPKRKEGQS